MEHIILTPQPPEPHSHPQPPRHLLRMAAELATLLAGQFASAAVAAIALYFFAQAVSVMRTPPRGDGMLRLTFLFAGAWCLLPLGLLLIGWTATGYLAAHLATRAARERRLRLLTATGLTLKALHLLLLAVEVLFPLYGPFLTNPR